ncbi:unnamed protein product [Ectocarpus sp. 4 AP-2014]
MLMECVKFGTVISVATPEAPGYFGCVVITFKTSNGANACAEAMHGRWFDQRQIEALVTGKEVLAKEGGENGGTGDNSSSSGKQGGGDGSEAAGEKEEEEEEETALGPLLQGPPDSPPPTDLNSFLESV